MMLAPLKVILTVAAILYHSRIYIVYVDVSKIFTMYMSVTGNSLDLLFYYELLRLAFLAITNAGLVNLIKILNYIYSTGL